MKKFIVELILIFTLVLVVGELTTRFFGLRSQNMDFPTYDKEGFYVNKPNSQGDFVFGKFPSVYKTKFNFNDIGFNTPLDYKNFNNKKITVAFLGDSYVESYHVDYNESFSSILMNQSNDYQSYDFGVSGYSMEDYIWVYKNFNLNKFDYVFLLTTLNDFSKNPNRNKYNHFKEKFRNLYNSFHFFSFLNNNHLIISSLIGLFRKNNDKEKKEFILYDNHTKFISKPNLIILPRDELTYDLLQKKKINNLLKIENTLKPINFGYLNGHWNKNGRINVISTIIPYLNKKKD